MATYSSYRLLKSSSGLVLMHVKFILVFVFLGIFLPCLGQSENNTDEIPLLIIVPRIGNTEVTALIKNDDAYLPLKDLFDYLKIKNTLSADLDSLSGYFITTDVPYLVDKINNTITVKGKVFRLSSHDLILTENNLYLRAAVFAPVFGLDCLFSFRNLSVSIKTQLELPAVRELQQELLRRNIGKLNGEFKADTLLKRGFNLFQWGAADWAVTSTQQTKSVPLTHASLLMGATLAGGAADVNLNYYPGQAFNVKQQYVQWRFVNNNLRLLKQITAGRIYPQSVSSIFAPVNGIQFTNASSKSRKSFGTFRYTGTTEPEWIVELYVNNILVNYIRADASGFYAFDIPVVYGSSVIKLRFYGPWGEEKTREEQINIPYNVLPFHQMEYSFLAGVVSDAGKSIFSRSSVNYGLSRRITIGSGMEYLSSVATNNFMPYVNASIRLGKTLVLSSEYTKAVRLSTLLNYRLRGGFQLDISYFRYSRNQTAVRYNYLEERKAALSFPLRIKNINALSRFSLNQFILPKAGYGNAEWFLSTEINKIKISLQSQAQFNGLAKASINSNLSFSFNVPGNIRLLPQIRYQYDQKKITIVKAEMEKRIFEKGYLNIAFEHNSFLDCSSFTLGLRFNFSMAQTLFSAKREGDNTIYTQSAKGSLIYSAKEHYLNLKEQASVGRGGVIIYSFIDLNCNGKRDHGEPRAYGLNIRMNAGQAERNDADTTIIITGLEPYVNYFIELDKNSFDNIAWQIKKPTIQVAIMPNQMKLVEIPVSVLGEVSGMVFLKNGQLQKGLSRIQVNICDSANNLVAHTLTEGDGYFNYLGLAPGNYKVNIDTAQLRHLNLDCKPGCMNFSIASNEEGVVADGFEFIVSSMAVNKDEEYPGVHMKDSALLIKGEPDNLNKIALKQGFKQEKQAPLKNTKNFSGKEVDLLEQATVNKNKMQVSRNKIPEKQEILPDVKNVKKAFGQRENNSLGITTDLPDRRDSSFSSGKTTAPTGNKTVKFQQAKTKQIIAVPKIKLYKNQTQRAPAASKESKFPSKNRSGNVTSKTQIKSPSSAGDQGVTISKNILITEQKKLAERAVNVLKKRREIIKERERLIAEQKKLVIEIKLLKQQLQNKGQRKNNKL